MLRALVFVMTLAAGSALAAEAPPNPAQAAPTKDKKPKLICRDEAPTGTRMVKRRCLTIEDWRQRERTAQDSLGDVQNRPSNNLERAG